jgi:hypothetical protein
VLQDGKLAERSLCKLSIVTDSWGKCDVLTLFQLGPVGVVDADILEVDAAVFEEETRSFGDASAIEVGQFVSGGHC